MTIIELQTILEESLAARGFHKRGKAYIREVDGLLHVVGITRPRFWVGMLLEIGVVDLEAPHPKKLYYWGDWHISARPNQPATKIALNTEEPMPLEERRKRIDSDLDEYEDVFFSSFPDAEAARAHARDGWDPEKPTIGDYEAFVRARDQEGTSSPSIE
jgi:hypothetical protein